MVGRGAPSVTLSVPPEVLPEIPAAEGGGSLIVRQIQRILCVQFLTTVPEKFDEVSKLQRSGEA